MDIMKLFDEYQKKFGEGMTVPYMLRADETVESFVAAVKAAIETGEPIDEAYWFGSDSDVIY